jgi:flavin-dependent dehydrogenase
VSALERRDAVIVGGGPAGATLARALSGAGASVVVLDKRIFPRDKTCAGWITPAVVASLGLDLEEYRRHGRVLQPISGFQVARMGSAPVQTTTSVPVSYGIRRCEFDVLLAQHAGCAPAAPSSRSSARAASGS